MSELETQDGDVLDIDASEGFVYATAAVTIPNVGPHVFGLRLTRDEARIVSEMLLEAAVEASEDE